MGTTLRMLSESTRAAPACKPLSLQRPDGYRPRLLLAEDSDPVRIVTAAMLKGMGCDVDAVVHGEEAVNSASAKHFDVIVLDIEMPVMDGITAARSIRKIGGPRYQTPIMALSAFLADAMQTASWSDTFDIALPKPANRNELHAAVKLALDRIPRPLTGERLAAEPVISIEERVALRSGLSAPVWANLASIACQDIEDCMAHVIRIARGEEADMLIVYAQKLKALGRTFAAPRLALVASHLEQATETHEIARLMDILVKTSAATIADLRS